MGFITFSNIMIQNKMELSPHAQGCDRHDSFFSLIDLLFINVHFILKEN